MIVLWHQLTVGKFIHQVHRHKLHFPLAVLQLVRLVSFRFANFFVERKQGVVNQLAERIIVKFSDGHPLILVFVFHVLDHVFEHKGGVTALDALCELLFLPFTLNFPLSIEINFRLKLFRFIAALVHFLELSFHTFKLSRRL